MLHLTLEHLSEAIIQHQQATLLLRGGIDASIELYKQAIGQRFKILVHDDYKCVERAMVSYVCDLVKMGAVLVCVFDGNKCAGKKSVHKTRNETRDRYRKLVQKYVGNHILNGLKWTRKYWNAG